MNILYIASVRIPDARAAGLAIARQCEAFGDVGHSLTLLAPNRYKVQSRELFSYYGVRKVFTLKYYPIIDIIHIWEQGFYLARLTEMISSFFQVLKRAAQVDIIYARDQWMLVLPIFFGFRNRCVIEMHTKHSNWAVRYVLKRARKIVVISRGLQRFYEDLVGRTDIVWAPSGVNLEQFNLTQTKAELRARFSLPADALIYGYVGKYSSFNENKGVDDIIEAFSIAHQQLPDSHLLIAGLEEREFSVVRDVLARFNIPQSAVSLFTLEQEKFSQYVVVADILLMNYPNTEHYALYMSPTKLFAYLATGYPIISSDLPSIRDIAGDELITFVASNDVIEYANAMVEAHNTLPQLQEYATKRREVVSHFEWKKRVEKII
jgi:glycosyltransferase involved in cell wall biosynthesis